MNLGLRHGLAISILLLGLPALAGCENCKSCFICTDTLGRPFGCSLEQHNAQEKARRNAMGAPSTSGGQQFDKQCCGVEPKPGWVLSATEPSSSCSNGTLCTYFNTATVPVDTTGTNVVANEHVWCTAATPSQPTGTWFTTMIDQDLTMCSNGLDALANNAARVVRVDMMPSGTILEVCDTNYLSFAGRPNGWNLIGGPTPSGRCRNTYLITVSKP